MITCTEGDGPLDVPVGADGEVGQLDVLVYLDGILPVPVVDDVSSRVAITLNSRYPLFEEDPPQSPGRTPVYPMERIAGS